MKRNTIQNIAQALVDLFYPLVEVSLEEVENPSMGSYTKPHLISENGRKVKTTDILIRDDDGDPKSILRIKYDVTLFQLLQTQITTLLSQEEESVLPQDRWKTQVDQTIHTFLKQRKITIPSASRAQKRELVLELYQKGLFEYKDAANYIGEVIDTSRATVYNYLNWATTLRRISIHQVDAFTDKRFGGNPAGVVLDAEFLSDDLMRKITREMNLSETAFVLPSHHADIHLRYFTPSGDEVRFCGHSTVGALYMLAREGRMGMSGPGEYTLTIETLCGEIGASISITDEENIHVGFEAPLIDLKEANYSLLQIANALGISPEAINDAIPFGVEKTNRTLFVPITSLQTLGDLKVDTISLADFSKKHDLVAICLLSANCFDDKNHVHCRVFAPSVGIPEDPFTGSVQGGLAAYLHQHRMVASNTKIIRAEQGHFMKRPGTVEIHLGHHKGQYKAKVYAQAIHFFSTQVELL
ncbi:MAG: PhzF family phenazine biosynthesis isomerase [Chlamydiales bacterium]|nr:PhzF family phenazine biosynthesis isomerase [Chlamydiales bacterium]